MLVCLWKTRDSATQSMPTSRQNAEHGFFKGTEFSIVKTAKWLSKIKNKEQ